MREKQQKYDKKKRKRPSDEEDLGKSSRKEIREQNKKVHHKHRSKAPRKGKHERDRYRENSTESDSDESRSHRRGKYERKIHKKRVEKNQETKKNEGSF